MDISRGNNERINGLLFSTIKKISKKRREHKYVEVCTFKSDITYIDKIFLEINRFRIDLGTN